MNLLIIIPIDRSIGCLLCKHSENGVTIKAQIDAFGVCLVRAAVQTSTLLQIHSNSSNHLKEKQQIVTLVKLQFYGCWKNTLVSKLSRFSSQIDQKVHFAPCRPKSSQSVCVFTKRESSALMRLFLTFWRCLRNSWSNPAELLFNNRAQTLYCLSVTFYDERERNRSCLPVTVWNPVCLHVCLNSRQQHGHMWSRHQRPTPEADWGVRSFESQ